MPLYLKDNIINNSKIAIWEITESLDSVIDMVNLADLSKSKLESFTSVKRKKEYVITRVLLEILNYSDSNLLYKTSGAPYLDDGKFISISHSRDFLTIIVSNKNVGIDIELKRDKILKIAHKFINKYETAKFDINNIETLTLIWNCKEAMFKLCKRNGIDFRKNLIVESIDYKNNYISGKIIFEDEKINVSGKFNILGDHTLVYLMND